MSGASALQTATVDGGTPVSGRRARTLSRRAGEAGAVCAAAGSGDAVQAAAGALLAMAAVEEVAAAVAGGLAAQGAPVEAPAGVHAAGAAAAAAAADVAMLSPPPLVDSRLRCRHPKCARHGAVWLRGVHMLRHALLLRVLVGSCTAGGAVVVTNPMWRSRRGSRSAGDVVEEKLYSDRLLDLVFQYGKKAAVYVCSEHTRLQGPRCTR